MFPTVYVESVSTPTVHVVSTDNVDYDAIAGDTYAFTLQVYGDCGTNARDIKIVQGNTPTNSPLLPATIDTTDLVHPTRWLTSHFATLPDTKLPITWPLDMRQKVVRACNDNLAARMQGGLTRAAVLLQTWKLGKVYVGDLEGSLTCTEPDEYVGEVSIGVGKGAWGYANVSCEPLLRSDIVHPVPEQVSGDRGGSR